ncbi:sugar phosphate isomerase/epimerase [bacterium]|nr:sugar phosphate isomerase/epimerase [bacterium]
MNKLFLSSTIKDTISESVKLASELGLGMEISRIPFYQNPDLSAKEMAEVLKNEIGDFENPLSIHAIFSDLNVGSQDKDIVKIADIRYKYSFKIAKELRAKTLLFHSGNKAMKHEGSQYKFIRNSVKYWKEFIKCFEDEGIVAVIENVHEREPKWCKMIIEEVNSPNLKLALDVGHANLFSEVPVVDWVKSYGKDLYHLHIHNNFKKNDDHFSLLNGSVDYKEIFDEIKRQNLTPQFVFEMFKEEYLRESLKLFKTFTN